MITPPNTPEVPKKTRIQETRILKIQEKENKSEELKEISTNNK